MVKGRERKTEKGILSFARDILEQCCLFSKVERATCQGFWPWGKTLRSHTNSFENNRGALQAIVSNTLMQGGDSLTVNFINLCMQWTFLHPEIYT